MQAAAECSWHLVWTRFPTGGGILILCVAVVMKDWASVINWGGCGGTAKQISMYTCPRVRQSRSSGWHEDVGSRKLTEREFWRVSSVAERLALTVTCSSVIGGPDCFRFGSHVYRSISRPYHHHPQHSSPRPPASSVLSGSLLIFQEEYTLLKRNFITLCK